MLKKIILTAAIAASSLIATSAFADESFEAGLMENTENTVIAVALADTSAGWDSVAAIVASSPQAVEETDAAPARNVCTSKTFCPLF